MSAYYFDDPALGSSPLARGLRPDGLWRRRGLGIIPARAGFTGRAWAAFQGRGDHPRSRGVYLSRSSPLTISTGSSPLARGLRALTVVDHQADGIIPARAGFTPGHHPPAPGTPDHPRSRGVYVSLWCPVGRRGGSSPLARGLHAKALDVMRELRIIPARAGFTIVLSSRGPPSADHPRSRGVYRRQRIWTLSSAGSSPLARGLLYRAWAAETHAGIIPARAGFTQQQGLAARGFGDHPRSRGVYT